MESQSLVPTAIATTTTATATATATTPLTYFGEYGSIFKLQMNVTIRPQNHLLPSSNLLG